MDKEREQKLLKMQIAAVIIGVLVVGVGLLISPVGRKGLDAISDKKEENKEFTPKEYKPIEYAKNKVDYSVISGTVTTVSQENPGQSVIMDQETFYRYQGFLMTVDLPKELKAEELTYEDDYMEKTLKIHFPIAYFNEFSENQPEGFLTDVASYEYKNNGSEGYLLVNFQKTFAFHYFVKGHKLYVSYGSPSYYYDQIVAVDAGHGGIDYGGYTADKVYIEKKINLEMTKLLEEDARQQDQVMFYFSRLDDDEPSLKRRVDLANDVGADLFISLHCNYLSYGVAYGVETCYNQRDKNEPFNSKWFAEKVQSRYPDAVGLYDRGLLADGDLKVLRLAKMPACLLEMGFVTNASDAWVMSNKKKQRKGVDAIESAIYEALEEMKHE